MKRAWWGLLASLVLVTCGVSAGAIDTTPSSGVTTKVSGPLIITGYSFSGPAPQYLQAFNLSNGVVDLDGWRVSAETATGQQVIATLSGLIAPGKYLTVARGSVLPTATFQLVGPDVPNDPVLVSVSLVPPPTTRFLNEVASPSVTVSTVRVAGTPPTYYFSRNLSTATGNYLSSFTAFVPPSDFTVTSDPLYEVPLYPEVTIVEVYADAVTCSPFETQAVCSDYVKLFNGSDRSVDLGRYRLRSGSFGQASTSSNTVMPGGLLGSGHYAAVPISLSASGSWLWLEDTYGVASYPQSLVSYPSSAGHDRAAWSFDQQNGTWRWTSYPTPSDSANDFGPITPINPCQGLVVSEIAAHVDDEDQFIEVRNATNAPLDSTGCRIQTNRSSTKFHVLNGVLDAGAYSVTYVKDSGLTLTKTTSGTVYLLSSDGATEVSEATYQALAEATSWADIAGQWLQTYAQTPGSINVWQQFAACPGGYERNVESGFCNKVSSVAAAPLACEEGKFRSPETNRCRAIDTSAVAAACATGQFRNPDTNRCKNLASTASLLTPCNVGQERNPETNRCRSVQASTSGQKPCATNQERNPDTNRCRLKAAAVAADFPIEAVAQSGQATIGWWAFGGVGTLAIGYAGWEWRQEFLAILRKIGSFGIGRS